MAAPKSGRWRGLFVCADRTIRVSISLHVSRDGALQGEYSFRDGKYARAESAGELEGHYADNLVTLRLAGSGEYSANFQGQLHPALPNRQQVLSGYTQVFLGSRTDAGVLVLFSELQTEARVGGWDG